MLLRAMNRGEETAADKLLNLVYDELHLLATRYMRHERPDHTMQATALINEAYIRMVGDNTDWQNHQHFIGVAATVMRRVLVDHARKRDTLKRGGGVRRFSIDVQSADCGDFGTGPDVDLLALDAALRRLSELQPRQARLVELRVFGGLSADAAAAAIDVAPSTAYKDWDMAKAWLLRELGG